MRPDLIDLYGLELLTKAIEGEAKEEGEDEEEEEGDGGDGGDEEPL